MSERQIGLRKRTRPFTQVPNDVVDDWTIGYRELGLLVRILRMPEGFVIRSEQLATEGKGRTLRGRKADREGREAVRTALRKLALAGYYRLVRIRTKDGTFVMATDISEDPVDSWASQAAVFGGKPVPLYEQPDGTLKVKYPDGTMLPDDSMPPPMLADQAEQAEQDPEDDQAGTSQTPETGFRAPASRAPVNLASGEAAPGEASALSKRVNEDGHKDSVPASQVRRAGGGDEASSDDGQLLIGGGVEPITDTKAPTNNDIAMGIARGWLHLRQEAGCPIVVRGKTDPLMALRGVALPALEAGYTDREIKWALMRVDRAIPTPNALDGALASVRRGWRPDPGWLPGDAQQGRPTGRQRNGTGAMAGTNLHVDDLTPEERQERNPFTGAARQSDYVEQRGAVA